MPGLILPSAPGPGEAHAQFRHSFGRDRNVKPSAGIDDGLEVYIADADGREVIATFELNGDRNVIACAGDR